MIFLSFGNYSSAVFREFSPQAEHMVHGTGTSAQVQHGGEGAGEVGLGPPDRFRKAESFGKVCGNRAGKRTAGAVGIGIRDMLSLKPDRLPVGVQQIVGIVHAVAAL